MYYYFTHNFVHKTLSKRHRNRTFAVGVGFDHANESRDTSAENGLGGKSHGEGALWIP